MREIKFRTWDLEKKDMSYFGLIELACCDEYLFKPTEYPDSPFKPQTGKLVELMQYTGLKDKNGKEIYEGDVVECKVMRDDNLDYWMEKPPRYFVGWVESGSWGLKPREKSSFREMPFGLSLHWEVIGNIYGNPELLK